MEEGESEEDGRDCEEDERLEGMGKLIENLIYLVELVNDRAGESRNRFDLIKRNRNLILYIK